MREQQGEKVSSLEMLNKLLVRDCSAQRWRTSAAAQLQKPGFGGSIMQEPWNQKVEKWSNSLVKSSGRYTVERPPLLQHLLAGSASGVPSPCLWKLL